MGKVECHVAHHCNRFGIGQSLLGFVQFSVEPGVMQRNGCPFAEVHQQIAVPFSERAVELVENLHHADDTVVELERRPQYGVGVELGDATGVALGMDVDDAMGVELGCGLGETETAVGDGTCVNAAGVSTRVCVGRCLSLACNCSARAQPDVASTKSRMIRAICPFCRGIEQFFPSQT